MVLTDQTPYGLAIHEPSDWYYITGRTRYPVFLEKYLTMKKLIISYKKSLSSSLNLVCVWEPGKYSVCLDAALWGER